jgi:hypothetical protein
MNPFFIMLQKDTAQSRVLLRHITKSQLSVLSKMARNIVKGTIPLTRHQINGLRPHARMMRKLASGNIKSGHALKSYPRLVSSVIKYTTNHEKSPKNRSGPSGRMGTIKRKNIAKPQVHQRSKRCESAEDGSDDDDDFGSVGDDSSSSSFQFLEAPNKTISPHKARGRARQPEEEGEEEEGAVTSA